LDFLLSRRDSDELFVTSTGSGAGGHLSGLSGADTRCQAFAAAVGAGSETSHAYLSTSTENGRDRIDSGPWFNRAGEQIAASVAALHTDGLSNGDPQHILDETGTAAPSNQNDILTGSLPDGTLTCADWTSNSETLTNNPPVGHSNIPGNPEFSPSGHAAQTSANCSQAGLVMFGGAGRLHNVRHSLEGAFCQGWDLHPAQLPVRYAGQSLLNYFVRAFHCGAITERELGQTGLLLDEFRLRSFTKILDGRRARG